MNRRKGLEIENNVDEAADTDSLLGRPQQTPAPRSPIGASNLSAIQKYVSGRTACRCLTIGLVLWLLFAFVGLIRDVFPETDLVLNSKCSRPMQNWDGKLLNVPVWWNSYDERPRYYNLHNENQYVGNDTNYHIHLKNHAGEKRPVILFGTHHKTGTFLAKKLFSRICSKMNWCCLFHVTRDSIHALSGALQNEPVNALGHNQWIWNPNALDIANYRFVHFYRHPYKKVISGYRYHADGTEEWTQKPLTYHELCASPLLTDRSSKEGASVDPKTVWKFCESVHLCETCCRMEHQREVPHSSGEPPLVHFRRTREEYQFLCDRLGQGKAVMDRAYEERRQHPPSLRNFHHTATPSIQEMLLTLPAKDGVLTEAALDYYENLRMARIINETAGDPHTLNIDIDDLNANFADVTLRLLRFIEGVVPSRRIKELHKDLGFYDLQTSPVYRWSMSNPIINHITGTEGGGKGSKSGTPAPAPSVPGSSGGGGGALNGGIHQNSSLSSTLPTSSTASSTYLMGILRNDPQVTKLYAPILEMMRTVLGDTNSKPTK